MPENAAIVRQFIEEVINQGDIDGAGRFIWEDVVEQVPFPGQGPGLSGLQDVLRGMRFAFPDLHWSVEEQLSWVNESGSRVAASWISTTRAPKVWRIGCVSPWRAPESP